MTFGHESGFLGVKKLRELPDPEYLNLVTIPLDS